MTTRLELPKFQAFDSNGDPLSGGLVYTYEAGTDTLKTTYSDYDASTANDNPVVLNSRGEADIYVRGNYKIVLKDSDDSLIWTLDNVQGGLGESAMSDYYFPDATATDQGVTGNSDTIKYAVDTASTDKATIYLGHTSGSATTTYTLTTSETIPKTALLKLEEGSIIDGAGTLTIYSPDHIDARKTQTIFGSSLTVEFTVPGEVYPEWWQENTTPGTTDMAPAIISAIASFPDEGGRLKLQHDTYRVNSSIVFPTVSGEIKGIHIEGSGSALGAGGATNPYGTRIDSYIAGGILFDLQTTDINCINIRFRNFTAYDRENSSNNYGIHAQRFLTGCVMENVGFKSFYQSIYIERFCYYSRIENVKSYYHRNWGMVIEGPNQCLFSRITCNNGTDDSGGGLSITSEDTPMRGVTIIGSFFEQNNGIGAQVLASASNNAYAVNIIGNYFESNDKGGTNKPNLYIAGYDASHRVLSGSIEGNFFGVNSGASDGTSISLGYVNNFKIMGNTFQAYQNNRTISSTLATGCFVASNNHVSTATIGVDIPEDNTMLDTGYLGPRIDNLFVLETDNSNVATSGTGEDDLNTYSVPANTMGTDKGIRVFAAGIKSNANGNKTLKLHWGSESFTFNAAANDTNDWRVEAEIYNTTASGQRISWKGWNGSTVTQGYEATSEDTTGAITVKITGECAHASDVITQTMWKVELIQ